MAWKEPPGPIAYSALVRLGFHRTSSAEGAQVAPGLPRSVAGDGSEPVTAAGAQQGQQAAQNRPLIRSGLCTTGSIGAPHFEHGPDTWAVRRHIRGPVSGVSVRFFVLIVSPKEKGHPSEGTARCDCSKA